MAQVLGVRETIVALRKIDPELRKDFNKRARKIAQPIVNDARSKYTTVPLSGMSRRWHRSSGGELFPFIPSAARKGVTVKIDTSKRLSKYGSLTGGPRRVGVVSVKQMYGAAVVFDFAGSTTDNRLGRQLTARFGQPSRVMWPAAESNLSNVQTEMRDLVAETTRTVQAAVNRV